MKWEWERIFEQGFRLMSVVILLCMVLLNVCGSILQWRTVGRAGCVALIGVSVPNAYAHIKN